MHALILLYIYLQFKTVTGKKPVGRRTRKRKKEELICKVMVDSCLKPT